MNITGLKIISVKDWRMASKFTADNGNTYDVPANQKIVCVDDIGDIINTTVVTDKPLNLKAGQVINLRITGSVTKNQFGWTLKGEMI